MLRRVGFLVLFMLASTAWAETPASMANADDPAAATLGESDHAALRELMAEATVALNSLDSAKLSQYLADDFLVTFADQTVITDLKQLDRYLDTYFRGTEAPLKSVLFNPENSDTTQFIDQRTGVVHGTSADTYTLANGSTLTLDTHWTATVLKDDGQWRIRAFHAGVNMLDNPILNATRQSGFVWGGLGLVAGLVLGVLLMRLRRRR